MKNYSIAFICPSQAWGGLEMNVYRLTEWLSERGWNIINYVHEDSPLRRTCEQNNYPIEFINAASKWEDLRWIGKTADSIVKHNCRIVLLHMNKNFLLTSLVKRRTGNFFKFLYEQHMHIGPAKKDWYHSWLYSHIDIWLSIVPTLAKQVRDKTTIPPDKVRVVPQGFDTRLFVNEKPSKTDARKKINLPENATIIGVVGRIDPQKCQHLLIEAAAKIHSEGFPVHILIVGGNSLNETTGYDRHLRDLTDKYKLHEYIHFHGHLDNPAMAYAAMDIFAMTTGSETFGTVTVEAMASGLPVVGSNDGGTVDLVVENERGYLFEPNNPDSLADKLLLCLRNHANTTRMAETAREYAIANFSHTRQCEMLEEIFDTLI